MTLVAYEKPLPVLTERNRPFWEGAKQGELRLQKCTACGHIRYPILPVCTVCLSDGTEWVAVSGKGEVFARLIYHNSYNAAFKDDIPYNVVLVQLDEGPRLYSNIVGTPNEEIKVGDRVAVTFDPVTDEISIPKFRIVGKAQGA